MCLETMEVYGAEEYFLSGFLLSTYVIVINIYIKIEDTTKPSVKQWNINTRVMDRACKNIY